MGIPQIQFATASDGVRVAYWTLGVGKPLLYVGRPCFTHAQLELHIPQFLSWYQLLAADRQVIRMDLRGYGASQRDDCAMSIAGFVRDMRAVAGALGLSRFSLFAQGGASVPALKLAAETDVIDHLVICDGWADGLNLPLHERLAAIEGLAAVDWPVFAEVIARILIGVDDDHAREVGWFIRQCVDAPAWGQYFALTRSTDVTALLPRITCPTLVVHTGPSRLTGQGEASRAIARAVPGARMVSVDAAQFPTGETDVVNDVLNEFLRLVEPQRPDFATTPLSHREREVLALVSRGRTNREIASALVISPLTADRHVHNILTKLRLANRTEAATWASSHFRSEE